MFAKCLKLAKMEYNRPFHTRHSTDPVLMKKQSKPYIKNKHKIIKLQAKYTLV